MFKELSINGKPCELMKAIRYPKYGSKTILTDSSWEYVSLFLKRQSCPGIREASLYWEQAHNFYVASLSLPDSARPLTSYYCILNAAKALLKTQNIPDKQLNHHGISTVRAENNKTNLKDAKTSVKGGGVLPELSKYYQCNMTPDNYCIFDLMYNIPCIHRAFCVTFSKPEIFIPISHPVFVKKDQSMEAWLKCTVTGRYANDVSLKSIPSQFEHDIGVKNEYLLRRKKRFNWDIHKDIGSRKSKLQTYHEKIRQHIFYINSESKLWYIKKHINDADPLSMTTSAVLIFCVFHWLSELVRYDPVLFQKYMKSKQNWLMHEFINKGLDQFIDEISCEITGEDIMCTGYRK